MNFTKNINNYIGMILFFIGIIFLGITSVIAFTNTGIWIDEIFTVQLIQRPLTEILSFTVTDVHPPLYYLVYKIIAKIAITLNITSDIKIIGKFTSLLPFYLLFLISFTKIRKNFNWLTAGLFSLTIITMPQLMNYATELRMYSFGLLFITTSFIVIYEIIKGKNNKKWVLLTILTICATYTHYYCCLFSVLLYLFLLIYLIKNDKKEIKKWIISSVIIMIIYIPWLSVFLNQMIQTTSVYWIPSLTFETIIGYIFFVFSPENMLIFGSEVPHVTLFGILLLISSIVLITDYIKNKKDLKSNFAISGIILFTLIPIIGIILSLTIRPLFIPRYLVPGLGILWLSISILLAKNFDKKYIFIPILIIILVSSVIGCYTTYDNQFEKQKYEDNLKNITFISPDDIIIIEGRISTGNCFFYLVYSYCLPNNEIITVNELEKEPLDKSVEKINEIINTHPNQKILIMSPRITQFNDTFDITYEKRVFYTINGIR